MGRRLWPTQVAESVPFDDTDVDFTADDVQEAIEQLEERVAASASPGYSFGKAGNINSGTWLLRVGSVPSNKAGVNVGLTDPELVRITTASEDLDTYDVSIYQHDGDEVNLTLIVTKSVVASRKEVFVVSNSLTADKQIAVKITSGSVKNVGVDLQLKGSVA